MTEPRTCGCGCGGTPRVGRYLPGHNLSVPEVRDRVIAKMMATNEKNKGPRYLVDDDGCHVWQWGTNGQGYPPEERRRHMYERKHGPYPQGHALHHSCGVALCVNPDHQVPLTHKQHVWLHRTLKSIEWKGYDTEARIALSQLHVEQMFGIPGHVVFPEMHVDDPDFETPPVNPSTVGP